MRAHQPGSTPIDIPETVPNPAHTPAPAPAPERAPTKVPDKVPEKVIAPASFDGELPTVVAGPDIELIQHFDPHNGISQLFTNSS